MTTKFYEFSQNNSGGGFDTDDDLCHRLFIEANDAEQANEIAEGLGVYFNGCDNGQDCSCCGDRWYECDESDSIDLEKTSILYEKELATIADYAQMLADNWGWTKPDGRIFYLDGRKQDVFKQETT